MKLLEVEGVSKRFGGLEALKNVSLYVNRGEILGLIGPNGAGKTTLFNVIAGTYRPDSGSIRFEGREITGWPPHKICKLGIARTFQTPKPFPNMTVYENVMAASLFGCMEERSPSEIKLKVTSILNRLGLEKKIDLPASCLTIYEQRMLEIARSLAMKPKLLLLDEVLAGLNPSETMQALNIIKELRSKDGITIVMIEHNMRAIMGVSDRIVVLHQGMKLTEGKPQEVANSPEVIRVYLGETYA
ncbi:MAG: ABC transporter ATP-binding protein [Candidatus Nezhaarchaeales archaeon]